MAGGVNFSVFSRAAERVWLRLYDDPGDAEPAAEFELDPVHHRTFFFWHVFVPGARAGQAYSWRTAGPDDVRLTGRRFDPDRELLDPWARAVDPRHYLRAAVAGGRAGAPGIRATVLPANDYDWEGDAPLTRAPETRIIYELHVRGFTRHPSSGVAAPGTFAGLIEKIPYLVELGITDVELLPIFAFDEQDVPAGVAELGLSNYWGYSPYGFFAPHPGYAAGPEVRNEFRDLVKALHRAGIGVILDVVLNHTAEGGEGGPILSFKGFGNEFFYHLDPEDRRRYRDFTGCGNTINCNHPLVTRFLVDCLEYWVREMHVDGFRLDLASVLARGEDGEPMYHAPVLWGMEFSPALSRSLLIAEAWDAAGLYQVGDFPGLRWSEWNGDYRDVIRRFVRGDPGLTSQVASRLAGSSDLYADDGRLPINSINFVTCHDGFTLADLVSYQHKHNEANGEGNRDGHDHNLAWNCGHEGPTDDPAIVSLRGRQARNFLTLLFLSHGIPMLLAGDELARSQQGNNNAWCQDNPTSWIDWSLVERHAGMLGFTRGLIALRRRHPSLQRARFLTGQPGTGGHDLPDLRWYDTELREPDWSDPEARYLAFTLAGRTDDEAALHVVMNMAPVPVATRLPRPPGAGWRVVVDTRRAEVVPPGSGALLSRPGALTVPAHTIMVFEASLPAP